MKYITRITLVTLLLALTGVVFSQGTTLVIFSENGEKFTLEINGSTQNYEPSARVETDDLYGPTTKVELYPADPQESMLKKSIFNKPNAVVYYVYKQDKKGRYFLEKTTHDRSGEVSGETPSQPPPPPGQKKKTESGGSGNCDDPVSYGEFQASLEAISRQPFDGPKQTAAKNLVKKKCLTSEQIADILYEFSYEGARLTFAKYAYTRVYDPDNYDLVRDVLDPPSLQKLDDYIIELEGK